MVCPSLSILISHGTWEHAEYFLFDRSVEITKLLCSFNFLYKTEGSERLPCSLFPLYPSLTNWRNSCCILFNLCQCQTDQYQSGSEPDIWHASSPSIKEELCEKFKGGWREGGYCMVGGVNCKKQESQGITKMRQIRGTSTFPGGNCFFSFWLKLWQLTSAISQNSKSESNNNRCNIFTRITMSLHYIAQLLLLEGVLEVLWP